MHRRFDATHERNYGRSVCCWRYLTAKCCSECAFHELEQVPRGHSFMDAIGVTRQLEYSKEGYDGNWVVRIDAVQFSFGLDILYHLQDIARQALTVASEAACKVIRPIVNGSTVVFLTICCTRIAVTIVDVWDFQKPSTLRLSERSRMSTS